MNINDIWSSPYKGSKYGFDSDGIYYRVPFSHQKIYAKKWNESIYNDLLNVKPEYGSFRITEDCKIITKVKMSDEFYQQYYVGEYDGSIEFSDVNLKPGSEISTGDIWPGFYHLHGARYVLSYYNEIFWRSTRGIKYYVISDNQDLIDKLRIFLPKGGRFYVTENGKVWTNAEHLLNWRRAENQIKYFSQRQKNLLQQRVDSTGKYPIYVCDYSKPLKIDVDDFYPDNSRDGWYYDKDEY